MCDDLQQKSKKNLLQEEHAPVYICFVGIDPPNINCANDMVNQTKLLEVSWFHTQQRPGL